MLEANSGLNPDLLRVLVDAHLNNPEPLMLALGLDMPKPKVKGTFAGIMTKPCKPDNPIGIGKRNPIGLDGSGMPKKELTLSCVGLAIPAQPISAVIEQQDDAEQQTNKSQPEHRGGDKQTGIIASATTSQRPAPAAQTDIIEESYTRHRDTDQPADYWDESQGEFIKPTVKASCKSLVTASVNAALESIGVSRRAPARVMRC